MTERSTGVDGMICTCSPEGEAEAAGIRLETCERLGCAPELLAVAVVESLKQTFDCDLFVDADMWFGVGYRVRGKERPDACGQPAADVGGYIQSDWPLDGYCWAWLRLADHHGRFPRKPMPDLLLRLDAMLATERETRAAWDAHHNEKHPGEDQSCWDSAGRPCDEGAPLWEAWSKASGALLNLWGVPNDESMPEWWGVREEMA